jgi:hypothetical protein
MFRPRDDLDMVSYGVVSCSQAASARNYPGMAWEPKKALSALADNTVAEATAHAR